MLYISKRGQKYSDDVLLVRQTQTVHVNAFLTLQLYSHKLTLGRAIECQMILRFVTNRRPAKM